MRYRFFNNRYYLCNGSGKTLWSGDKVAICLSYHPDLSPIRATLLKHGDPALVKKWWYNYKEKLKVAYEATKFDKYLKEINDLVLVEGQIPVEDLNKCIDITGYVAVFYEKVLTGCKLQLEITTSKGDF